MDDKARATIVTAYRRFLKRHGPTEKGVNWATPEAQQVRFQLLEEAGPWDGVSVADIGCGVGDFYGYLKGRGHSFEYTGYDITPEMIDAARAKYPEAADRFELRDITAEGLPAPFDYVVASGTFNIRVEGHDSWLRENLAAMYRGCRRAVAFNFLAPMPPSHPDYEFKNLYYGNFYYEIAPEELADFCRTLSPLVDLREGYLQLDTTMFIRRPVEPGHTPAR